MRFVDWFSGIGGMRLACEQAGWQCIGACEWNLDKRAVYTRRFDVPDDWFPRNLWRLAAPPPEAVLWTASGPPKLLLELLKVSGPVPRVLWLQTAPQSVDCLARENWYRQEVLAGGRIHVFLSKAELPELTGDDVPIHKPDAVKHNQPLFKEVADAEEAQGFPRGWTRGYSDAERRNWLAASVTVQSTAPLAVQLLTALQNTVKVEASGNA